MVLVANAADDVRDIFAQTGSNVLELVEEQAG